ncbi:MAG: cupredoxin domain-containing protein [Tepidiformaceae bacterium]
MRHPRFILIAALLVGGAACSEDSGTGSGAGGRSLNVSVRNNFFSPTPDTVGASQTVTWTWNSGGTGHNVTFEDGVESSVTKGAGSHPRTFAAAGTHRYRCTIHSTSFTSGMVGRVVVE